eukprot:CAMPEP_0119043368 /NCGR_PEP_ID=MMETSP1177-20130426/21181_1 /TAXON_ID=2985 /ORGANISM="Ochromonas sp, Strain CCMP1899" /LENGTH=78 /DNA_ID=CAMNT_0007011309 /DNA_START=5 /DNA_END=238 /DNA_ORIENTATION=+
MEVTSLDEEENKVNEEENEMDEKNPRGDNKIVLSRAYSDLDQESKSFSVFTHKANQRMYQEMMAKRHRDRHHIQKLED